MTRILCHRRRSRFCEADDEACTCTWISRAQGEACATWSGRLRSRTCVAAAARRRPSEKQPPAVGECEIPADALVRAVASEVPLDDQLRPDGQRALRDAE